MLVFYSLLLTLAMLLMSPLFLLRRQKYASGFRERLGNYPKFKRDGRKVIWLHCVSVGETNAARPLVEGLLKAIPGCRLVVSTTTRTGNELAKQIFMTKADSVFYFPFDWKFSTRRALKTYGPSLVLLMETEIWPRLIAEAKKSGAKIAIVNGRLSQRSSDRYSKIRPFVRAVLRDVDLALMQSEKDAERIKSLGIDVGKVQVTGNLKFDLSSNEGEVELTRQLKRRFQFDGSRPLIVAASTHEPEEKLVLRSLEASLSHDARLLIAPRHPERFDSISELLENSKCRFVRRSDPESEHDRSADVILLDSIGELRAVYPLAEIAFVGGSLIPHGGQSILEPAALAKPIITGPYTHNFDDAVKVFLDEDAMVQLPETKNEEETVELLSQEFEKLLHNVEGRAELSAKTKAVMNANRGATDVTVRRLRKLVEAE